MDTAAPTIAQLLALLVDKCVISNVLTQNVPVNVVNLVKIVLNPVSSNVSTLNAPNSVTSHVIENHVKNPVRLS